jgi:hypothetical protein
MTWYAASIITVTKLRDGVQTKFPVYEDVYLVEADTDGEALQKAKAIGTSSVIDDPSLTLGGQPARDYFAGIRKLITVRNPDEPEPDQGRPCQRSEVTYSRYTLESERDIDKLARGEPVSVIYED